MEVKAMKKVLVVQDDKLNGGLNVQLLEEEYEVLTVPIRLTQTPTICRVPLPIVRRDILHVVGVCLHRIGTVETFVLQ